MINDELRPEDLNMFSDDAFDDMPSSAPAPASRATVEQQNALKQRLSSMGVKLTQDPSMMSEGHVPVTSANASIHQTIQRIKSGAARSDMKDIAQKAERIAAQNSPPPIHQPRKNKPQRPGQPQQPSNAPKVETFAAGGGSREARDIESMFTDDGGGSYFNSAGQSSSIREDDFGSTYLPTFDPVSELRKRAAEKGVSTPQVPVQKPKQASSASLDTVPQDQLVQIMETVSRRVSEDMLKKVLKEFSIVFSEMQNQKSKNVFEVYNKDKNIIKIGSQLYQLTPVRIKGKD